MPGRFSQWNAASQFAAIPTCWTEGIATVAPRTSDRYAAHMNRLTKQEQMVLCVVLGLLLTGWAVKAYRTAHPAAPATESTKN
jgi:hypothetical protein